MQELQIDLRVGASGIDVLMSQHRADLGKRCAFPQNVASEFMTKLMGGGDRQVDSRLLEGMLNLRPDATCDMEISNRYVGARKTCCDAHSGRPWRKYAASVLPISGVSDGGLLWPLPRTVSSPVLQWMSSSSKNITSPAPNPRRASRIKWSRRPIALFQSMLPRSLWVCDFALTLAGLRDALMSRRSRLGFEI